jgi:hypothetical protein
MAVLIWDASAQADGDGAADAARDGVAGGERRRQVVEQRVGPRSRERRGVPASHPNVQRSHRRGADPRGR